MNSGPSLLMRALVPVSIGPVQVQVMRCSLLWPHLTARPLHQNKPIQEPVTQRASGEAHPKVDSCTQLVELALASDQATASEHAALPFGMLRNFLGG